MRSISVISLILFVGVAQAANWAYIKPLRIDAQYNEYSRAQSRIVGGNEAEVHQFPYQIGIVIDNTYLCGGSLISNTMVLTAAHCTYKYSSFEVNLAAHNIMDEGEPDRQIVMASAAITHENWNPSNVSNDIALLVLSSPVSGQGIDTVRLPSRSQVNISLDNTTARVSGWGKVSDDMVYPSPKLNYVDLKIVNNQACQLYGIVTEKHICCDTAGGTTATCSGDSGGPLVIYENDGLPTQVGIVSGGPGQGCESGPPVFFTRLTSYLDWLENNSEIIINP